MTTDSFKGILVLLKPADRSVFSINKNLLMFAYYRDPQ